jgi:hypothetical protein
MAGDGARRWRPPGRNNNKERAMKGLRGLGLVAGMALALAAVGPAAADGFKDCTKAPKASWKPASDAEAAAKAAGYEVRRSKIEGSCYEVYGVKDGKLFELFYSPTDLKLTATKAK